MWVRVKILIEASFLVLIVGVVVLGQVAELPVRREWGIRMSESVRRIEMADIDGDGIDEILVGTGNDSGFVYVLNGINHETEWKSPGLMGRVLSIGVGDADGDGTKEIIVGTGQGVSDSGNVYVFDGVSHALKWHRGGLDEQVYSVAIGDYDKDNSIEILLGTYWNYHWLAEYLFLHRGGHLFAFDGRTHHQELSVSPNVVKRMKILDVNGDLIDEVVTGESYLVIIDEPHSHYIESQVSVSTRRDSIELASRDLFFYGFTPYQEPIPHFLEMAVGDCDSQLGKEVICSYVIYRWPYYNEQIEGLKVLDGASLNLKWSRVDTAGPPNSYPNPINGLAVDDLNGDGINDIVAAYSEGWIRVIDGVTSADSAISRQLIPISHFAYGDVDEDEESEACISDGDSLILLEVHPFTAVRDKHQNPSSIPIDLELSQNWPNPFNSTTAINYQLSAVSDQRSAVSLKIYNILGQVVRKLVNEEQVPGYYSVRWDGKDSGGNPVASGVYFCRLQVLGDRLKVVKTRKMILLR